MTSCSVNLQVAILACWPLAYRPNCSVDTYGSLAVLQRGDAFDLATVLASLLLGAGYNAFVAMGYAPLAIALNDQSAEPCPYVSMDVQEGPGPEQDVHPGPAAEDWERTGAVTGIGAGGLSRAAADGGTSADPRHEPQQGPAGPGSPDSAARSPRMGAALGERPRRPAAKPAQEDHAPLRAPAGTAASGAAGSASASASPAQGGKHGGASASSQAPKGASSDPAPAPGFPKAERPPRLSKLVHAWVLVLPNRREVRPHAEPSLQFL